MGYAIEMSQYTRPPFLSAQNLTCDVVPSCAATFPPISDRAVPGGLDHSSSVADIGRPLPSVFSHAYFTNFSTSTMCVSPRNMSNIMSLNPLQSSARLSNFNRFHLSLIHI